jgi:Ca2+-binding EF-hand superfamily protein
MRPLQLAAFVVLVTALLIFFPASTGYSTAVPLPKGLPPWFKQLDEDKDGQISLAEWLHGGRRRDEFDLYDLNEDGFITPDEVFRVMKKVQPLKLSRGQLHYEGMIDEPTDERYEGKKAFKILTIKLEEGKIYQIEEVSQIYYAFLYLEDPNGDIVAQHNSGGRGLTSRIVYEAAETGTYRIIATSQDGVKTGEFKLSIRVVKDLDGGPPTGLPAWFKELDKNEDGQVSLPQWLKAGRSRETFRIYDLNGDGFITADEVLRVVKKVENLKFDGGQLDYQGTIEDPTDERYEGKKNYRIFTIKMEEGKIYQIEEVSEAFFAFLYLEDPSGEIVAEHNSGGQGKKARLIYQAQETGIHRIIATSHDGVKTGDFSLSIWVIRDADELEEALAKNLPAQPGDPDPESSTGLPAWFDELDIDEDGQVSLPEWLLGGRTRDEFRVYDLNGDGFITPEEVLRVVKKVKHLKLEHGKLYYKDKIDEPTNERYEGKKAFKIFTIRLELGQFYQIEAVSQIYYAHLFLEDPNGEIVAEHDSGGYGLTARIIHEAEETGIYRLVVTSQGGFKTGEFMLTIRTVKDLNGIPPPPAMPEWFKKLDENKDGQVSLQEWVKGGKPRDEFRVYDLNGDGFITPDEVLLYTQRRSKSQQKPPAKIGSKLPEGLPPWFKELDKNHDGQISLLEWLNGGKTRDEFRVYDLNGDGFITADEVLRYLRSQPKTKQ